MPRRISKSKFDPQRARCLWLRPTPIRFQCYTDRVVLWRCRYFLLFEFLCSKSYWRIGQDQRPTGSWGPRRQLGWTATLWSSTSSPSLDRWAINQYMTDTFNTTQALYPDAFDLSDGVPSLPAYINASITLTLPVKVGSAETWFSTSMGISLKIFT